MSGFFFMLASTKFTKFIRLFTHNPTPTAICQDGTYYRFSFNLRGESTREYFAHFLEMTDNL